MHPAVAALGLIHCQFIGGFRTRRPKHSRYMPHIGAKERARHAGKPDGVMHAAPPIHLRNTQAIAAKPRTRKAVAS